MSRACGAGEIHGSPISMGVGGGEPMGEPWSGEGVGRKRKETLRQDSGRLQTRTHSAEEEEPAKFLGDPGQ